MEANLSGVRGKSGEETIGLSISLLWGSDLGVVGLWTSRIGLPLPLCETCSPTEAPQAEGPAPKASPLTHDGGEKDLVENLVTGGWKRVKEPEEPTADSFEAP